MVLNLTFVDILKIDLEIVIHGKTGLLNTRSWFDNLNFDKSRLLFGEERLHCALCNLILSQLFNLLLLLKFVFLLWLLQYPLGIWLEKRVYV